MSFGKNLRTARKNAGLTQRELAEKIGAKHNSVSNWENDLNFPGPAISEKIYQVLQVTPNELFGTQTQQSPSLRDTQFAIHRDEGQELTDEMLWEALEFYVDQLKKRYKNGEKK